MVVANPVARAVESARQSSYPKTTYFLSRMVKDYTGVTLDPTNLKYEYFNWETALRGWGPIAGAFVVKKGMNMATKGMKLSLIPRLR